MNAFNIIKFIGAWGCLMGAIITLILLKEFGGLTTTLSLLSIAFSQAPANG